VDLESFLLAACELLAIPSTAARPDDLHRALNMVLEFAGPGNMVERFDAGDKPSALVYPGRYSESGRPEFGVILNAHLDVVPAPDELFAPRRDGDRLYARGAMDMKVSGLVMALVYRELAPRLSYPLALQLVTDEEKGGFNGTRYQLDEEGVTARFAIMGESSGLNITTECKGGANVVLTAEGRNAHGAYPWLGDNAVLKLHRSIGRLLEKYPVPEAEAWRTTVNVARVDTDNQAFNQVPARAQAWLDIRFPAGDPDLDRADSDEIARYLSGLLEPGVSAAVQHVSPPAHADPDSAEVTALRAAVQSQGYEGKFLRKHGTGDARFCRRHGINAVSFGIGGEGQHGPHEYADLPTVVPYYNALSDFLTKIDPLPPNAQWRLPPTPFSAPRGASPQRPPTRTWYTKGLSHVRYMTFTAQFGSHSKYTRSRSNAVDQRDGTVGGAAGSDG
jgi:succinyl-diaminopimelate desuccinylase